VPRRTGCPHLITVELIAFYHNWALYIIILFEPFLKFEQINMCRIQISIINIHTICTGFIFCLRIGQANKIICVTTITCIEFYKLFRNSTKAA
jgi:hypothetical protein